MLKPSMLSFFMLVSGFLISQNQEVEFTVSNDKFAFLDRYYTSGLHLVFRKSLDGDFLFLKNETNKLQMNITVGNETYTPKNLTSFNSRDFDRPYAGWFFGKLELIKVKQKSAVLFGLESGITGEESLSGKLQTIFHEFLNIESRPTWADEIAFKWLFNLKWSYINNFQLSNKSSFQNQIKTSLGSKDTYIGSNFSYFFGKLDNFQNSSRLDLVNKNKTKELFGFLSVGYKYVALNALIQGSDFNNNDSFTSIASNHIFQLGAGSVLRSKNHLFKLNYYYNSKETPISTYHVYGSLTYGRFF